jgi:hypothetical protein
MKIMSAVECAKGEKIYGIVLIPAGRFVGDLLLYHDGPPL